LHILYYRIFLFEFHHFWGHSTEYELKISIINFLRSVIPWFTLKNTETQIFEQDTPKREVDGFVEQIKNQWKSVAGEIIREKLILLEMQHLALLSVLTISHSKMGFFFLKFNPQSNNCKNPLRHKNHSIRLDYRSDL